MKTFQEILEDELKRLTEQLDETRKDRDRFAKIKGGVREFLVLSDRATELHNCKTLLKKALTAYKKATKY